MSAPLAGRKEAVRQAASFIRSSHRANEEQLCIDVWQRAQQEAESCDLMLVAGASLDVIPSAGLPMCALENEARLNIVNLSPTYLDTRANILITADIVDIIPQASSELLDD